MYVEYIHFSRMVWYVTQFWIEVEKPLAGLSTRLEAVACDSHLFRVGACSKPNEAAANLTSTPYPCLLLLFRSTILVFIVTQDFVFFPLIGGFVHQQTWEAPVSKRS